MKKKAKIYNQNELSQVTGLSVMTIKKYEKLGIITSKKPPNKKRKVYFENALIVTLILKFMIENLALGKTAIMMLFKIAESYNIDIKDLVKIGDKMTSQEQQEKNIAFKQTRSSNLHK